MAYVLFQYHRHGCQNWKQLVRQGDVVWQGKAMMDLGPIKRPSSIKQLWNKFVPDQNYIQPSVAQEARFTNLLFIYFYIVQTSAAINCWRIAEGWNRWSCLQSIFLPSPRADGDGILKCRLWKNTKFSPHKTRNEKTLWLHIPKLSPVKKFLKR